jgi:hypothetical protein
MNGPGARGLLALILLGCLPGLSACMPAVRPTAVQASGPPDWRPGDRWVYEWKSGKDAGTKTAEVVEAREVNKTPYYVIRIEGTDHFYTRDLHWAAIVRESRVEARMTPPQPWFLWPLDVGRRWEHRGLYEERGTRHEQANTFAVVAAESVQVPAGQFAAVKIVREGNRADSDQYWFVPEMRWYVKWIGRRGEIEFEEGLREYQAAPRLIPGAVPESSGPKTP